MSMLREDGCVEIYKIQTKSAGYKQGSWFYASLDHFGYPEGFSAADTCWQRTGHTGTFNKEEALAGLKWISNKHPGISFRIVKLTLTQKTQVVCTNKENQ